eukprot:2534982-Prymnesium_polylepis.1
MEQQQRQREAHNAPRRARLVPAGAVRPACGGPRAVAVWGAEHRPRAGGNAPSDPHERTHRSSADHHSTVALASISRRLTSASRTTLNTAVRRRSALLCGVARGVSAPRVRDDFGFFFSCMLGRDGA